MINDNLHQATFTGHVVVVQPTVTVHADLLVALYGSKRAGSINDLRATGDIEVVTADQTATGDLALFDPNTQLLTLTGNVVVTGKSGQVKSDKLVVDLTQHKSVFQAGNGRITGVFSEDQ